MPCDGQPVARDVEGLPLVPAWIECQAHPTTRRPRVRSKRTVAVDVPRPCRWGQRRVPVDGEPKRHLIRCTRALRRGDRDDRMGPRPVLAHQAPVTAIDAHLEAGPGEVLPKRSLVRVDPARRLALEPMLGHKVEADLTPLVADERPDVVGGVRLVVGATQL